MPGTTSTTLLGRTTTLPASDAPNPAGGNITIGYYDNDLARSIAQGGTTTTYTLDALDRRSVETATTAGGSTDTIRHYTDTSDNPTWVTAGTTSQRYAELIGGDLSLTVDQTGKASLPIANPHGDTVTTIDLTGAQPATSIGAWCNYDEYGLTARRPIDRADRLWLAWRKAAGDHLDSGLILMGVRLYNPDHRAFHQPRPSPRRKANAYTYPTDPINGFDLRRPQLVAGRSAETWGRSDVCGAVTSPSLPIGAASVWLRLRWLLVLLGHRCRRSYGMMTCSGGLRIYGRGGTTYGSVYITVGVDESLTTGSRSSTRRYTGGNGGAMAIRLAYLVLRVRDRNPCRNRFEKRAGWANVGTAMLGDRGRINHGR